jgi:hypothetical protein
MIMDEKNSVLSEWEENERAMKQAQTERRYKVLPFSEDALFYILHGLLDGSEWIIRSKDGQQRRIRAIENALPRDAHLTRVSAAGEVNSRYDFARDRFELRIVSKEFEPVPLCEVIPELSTVVMQEDRPECVSHLLRLPWVVVPDAGLEVVVDKTKFKVAAPSDWPESENEVTVLITPKSA